MSRKNPGSGARTAAIESGWRGMYVAGGVAALLALAGTLTDIIVAMLPGWETTTTPETVQAWFVQFQTNPLLGLRNLDLLNVVISAIGIPMYLALYGIHRRFAQAPAMLALIVVLVGTVILTASSAALPMLDLSAQYASAATDAQRLALEAAGMSLLARGAHGSMGAFMGFFVSGLGTLLMGIAMLTGRVFGRVTAWLAIAGTTLLIAYSIGVAFTPIPVENLVVLAMFGGLPMMAWNVIVARRLLRMAAVDGGGARRARGEA